MTGPTVYDRIAAAYKDIAAEDFTKAGTVKGNGGGYKYIPIGQILAAVRKAHAKHGVIVIFGRPEYDSEQSEKRYTIQKDGQYGKTTWTYANGHIDVRIYGGSSDDVIELTVPCEASDNSDKLTNKLITNAERTLYRTLYAIDEGDGEDPEAVNEPIIERAKPREGDAFFSPRKKLEITDDEGDRTREQMLERLSKWGGIEVCATVIRSWEHDKGRKIDKFDMISLTQCYKDCIAAARSVEGADE